MELLNKKKFGQLTNLIKQAMINLFACSVIDMKILGPVFVDNFENPKTLYVVHPLTILLTIEYENN